VVRKAAIGVDGGIAQQYGAKHMPTTPGTTTLATTTAALGNVLCVAGT
jgi:hypothetical protein